MFFEKFKFLYRKSNFFQENREKFQILFLGKSEQGTERIL